MQMILLFCLIAAGNEPVAGDFTDVQIREPYRRYLLADPLLMQEPGATVIELANGRRLVIAVASAVLESTSPRHRLEGERVCRVKALAHLVARRIPARVVHSAEAKDRVVITLENGRERAESYSELTEIIRASVEGQDRELPVVGRWLSRDRSTLYLAIGTIVNDDAKSAPVSQSNDPYAPADKAPPRGLPWLDSSTVIAEGAGLSPEEAHKDALRNAVRQVVGLYINPEMLVRNDRIVSERLLAYSDGFVSKYHVLEESYNGGLYRYKIAAVVERRPLVQRLQDSKLIVHDVDGRDIATEIVTRREAEQNAAELLGRALENFPANVLQAEVVRGPKIVSTGGTNVPLVYRLRISVNLERYETFRSGLIRILDRIAAHKGSFVAWNIYVPARFHEYGNKFFTNEFLRASAGTHYDEPTARFGRFETVHGTRFSGLPSDWRQPRSEAGSTLFVINTGSDRIDHKTYWRWFKVPLLANLQYRTVRVEVTHVGDEGDDVTRGSFVIGPRLPGMSIDDDAGSSAEPRKVVISPYVLFHSGTGYLANVVTHAQDMTVDWRAVFELSRLATVQAVQCRVTMDRQ